MNNSLKLRNEITAKFSFLQLSASLMKGIDEGNRLLEIKETFTLIHDFLISANDEQVNNKGSLILELIEPLFQTAVKKFSPKKDIYELAIAYNDYCKQHPNYSTEYGIWYGWLNEQIDCKSLYSELLPAHTRVGTYHHAGMFIIEESVILRDAFFFLLLAENEVAKLDAIVTLHNATKQKPTKKEMNAASVQNANVGTYSRTSLLMFYSFIEAYVNGIGLDHLFTYAVSLTEEDKELLQGRHKNNYLSLEKKLEKYHQIIRLDKKQQFVTTSKAQHKEPFKSFFDKAKSIRDSSVHFSALKEPIVRKPHEWLSLIKEYGKITLDVAKVFWDACYSPKKYPSYLDFLDYNILKGIAQERINEDAI